MEAVWATKMRELTVADHKNRGPENAGHANARPNDRWSKMQDLTMSDQCAAIDTQPDITVNVEMMCFSRVLPDMHLSC